MIDPMDDLIKANQAELLRKHQEALALIAEVISKKYDSFTKKIELIVKIIEAARLFHPMHAESWKGWPEI